MYKLKEYDVWVSEIAGYLNAEYGGQDFIVAGPQAIHVRKSSNERSSLTNGEMSGDVKYLLLTDKQDNLSRYSGYILSRNPEVDLALTLREFFATASVNEINKTAQLAGDAQIGRNVAVGANTVIGPGVKVADNTIIMNNVVINGPAIIGSECVIKDGAVVGSEGYCFVEDEEGRSYHVPQLGTILIQDRAWIGTNSTIERGICGNTIIGKDVKVDDLVHIGSTTRIGRGSKLTTGTVVAHNVTIGNKVLIAPNVVVKEFCEIGNDVTVGQGAVVIDNLEESGVYVGNPAHKIRRR
jgi:UDP-3-O-[3-hydroxymyristoyl] glucosamine N-acyltransferase